MANRTPFLLLSTTVLGLCSVSYAADETQILYTNKRDQPLPLSNVEVGAIKKSRLFVSTDNGRNWVLQHEMQVPEDAKEVPKFPFHAVSDGAYGVIPCTTYRNGKIEPDPVPGQAPPFIIMVDTIAPTISSFDATMIGRSAQKAVVRVTWSVKDLHLGTEPIAIEATTESDTRYTTIHRGDKDGAAELVVPVTPESSAVQLRLVVTDLARNVTISPSRSFSVEPLKKDPPEKPQTVAPTDPKDALAQAAGTLPSLAEVGVPSNKPLPTTPIARPSQENPNAITAPKTTPALTEVPAVPTVTSVDPQPNPPPAPKPNTETETEHADIVVNGKPYEPPTPPVNTPQKTDEPEVVIASDAVDQEYYKKLAAMRNFPPENVRTAPRAAATAPIEEETTPAVIDGRRLPPRNIPEQIDDPVQLLTNARLFVVDDKIDEACDLYERLRFTSIGKTALHEQVHILNVKERPRDAITAIMSAPVEIVTNEIRLDHGRALLLTGRPEEVVDAVSLIPSNAPESRPALLLMVKAYLAMGRTTEAHRGLNYLARGDDAVAAEARALRDR